MAKPKQTIKEEVKSTPRHNALEAIKEIEAEATHTSVETDPEKNHDAISIVKQRDGNWIGKMWRFGKVVSCRQYDPQIVLQMLLTQGDV
jgi:hypothetical protein